MVNIIEDFKDYLLSDSCIFSPYVPSENELILIDFSDGKFFNVDNMYCFLVKEYSTISIFAKSLIDVGSWDICGIFVALSKFNKEILLLGGSDFGWYSIDIPEKFMSAIIKSRIFKR